MSNNIAYTYMGGYSFSHAHFQKIHMNDTTTIIRWDRLYIFVVEGEERKERKGSSIMIPTIFRRITLVIARSTEAEDKLPTIV